MSYNFIVKFTSVLRQKVDTREDVEAKFRGVPADRPTAIFLA